VKDHNALALGWFRTRANFDANCPMRRNGVFGEFDDSHALVAVASNDFHKRGISDGHNDTNQERPMGAVMVRCPETGRDIPTGLVTDRKSFDATPVFFARVYCPICRTEHEWFAKEAWVCEAEPRPQRGVLL
jgi:hypothetical protein